MRTWSPDRIARAAHARLVGPALRASGPDRVTIDSRQAGPGALFVGLPGTRVHGGRFAGRALAAGAWGVLTTQEHAEPARASGSGVVLAANDPVTALGALAHAWRGELGTRVIGVTGSTGKTSTKDILLALLAPHRRTIASRANHNTEIGLPLEILAAPAGTEVLVLEMAMRGRDQIARLTAIAEPDVGVIVTIGPVHLELLGTLENIAAAKAELIAGLPGHGTAVIPAAEGLLDPHRRADITTVTFGGADADVRLARAEGEHVVVDHCGEEIALDVSFTQAHLRANLLAALAAAKALGVTPSGRVDVAFSPGRGQRTTLPTGVVLIDDCYNANPMSMRAALDDLARTGNGASRRIAVLGDMLELGPAERRFHAEIGAHARRAHVDVLVTVGPLAAVMADGFNGEVHRMPDAAAAAAVADELLRPGDLVLVKGSRGVGLELVCGTLGNACRA